LTATGIRDHVRDVAGLTEAKSNRLRRDEHAVALRTDHATAPAKSANHQHYGGPA
jgi:hypothetical protein